MSRWSRRQARVIASAIGDLNRVNLTREDGGLQFLKSVQLQGRRALVTDCSKSCSLAVMTMKYVGLGSVPAATQQPSAKHRSFLTLCC